MRPLFICIGLFVIAFVTGCDVVVKQDLDVFSTTELHGNSAVLTENQTQSILETISDVGKKYGLECRGSATTCNVYERGFIQMRYIIEEYRVVITVSEFCGPCRSGSRELTKDLRASLENEVPDIEVATRR